jgi:hypothetical protein
LAGSQLVGEFLPFFIKIIPFVGSMFSVGLIFILNSSRFEKLIASVYLKEDFRSLHRFLSHK